MLLSVFFIDKLTSVPQWFLNPQPYPLYPILMWVEVAFEFKLIWQCVMFLFGPRVHLVGWKTRRIENGKEKIVFWVVWFGEKRGKILVGLKYSPWAHQNVISPIWRENFGDCAGYRHGKTSQNFLARPEKYLTQT